MLLSLTYGIPPDELYDRLSGEDLADLTDYYTSAPWGPDIEDIRDARRLMFQAAASGVRVDPQEVLLGEQGSPQEIEMDAEAFEALIRGAAMKQIAAGSTAEAAQEAAQIGGGMAEEGGAEPQPAQQAQE